MNFRLSFIIVLLVICSSCKGQGNNSYASANPVHIKRFDKALYQLLQTNDTTLVNDFQQTYYDMLEVTGKGILNIQSIEQPGFLGKLFRYYSEPTLKGLYKDAITQYDTIDDIEQQLGSGFAFLKDHLPSLPIPEVYMHVSGFNQNVLVAENLLSVSIDKYLGKEYPLYKDFFYEYQLAKMHRSHIVPDYLAGWLMSEYVFSGKENVLLDRMVYQGKIKYLVSEAVPGMEPYELMGYTKEQYEWCKENEGAIWKSIIENKHLYTPDHLTTNMYFEDMPHPAFAEGSPGNIGAWIGWQIVDKYMRESKALPESLMQQTNAQEILTASKYKPF